MDAVLAVFQIIGALGAAGAAIAAALVVYQGNKQLKETQESRYDSLRPLLVPQDMLQVRAHVGEQDETGGSLETRDPGYDANAQHIALSIKNVGPGIATSVTGVIFGPEPHAGEMAGETGHSLRLGLPLEPGAATTTPDEWIQGGLMLTGTT